MRLTAEEIEAKSARNRAARKPVAAQGMTNEELLNRVNALRAMIGFPPLTMAEALPILSEREKKPIKQSEVSLKRAKKQKTVYPTEHAEQSNRKPKQIIPTEHEEQKKVIEWCDKHPIAKHIFSIPNGSHKSPAMAAKFKREGLRSGVPDLFLPVALGGFHGLFIEMKRRQGSKVSVEQFAWGKVLNEQQYCWMHCYGADDAIRVIESYLAA